MKTSQFWTSKVTALMNTGGIPYSEAWSQAAKIYPNAATLMRAAGLPRASVQFFNSKLATAGTAATRTANEQFQIDVKNEMDRTGLDYTTVWNRLYPASDLARDQAKRGAATSQNQPSRQENSGPDFSQSLGTPAGSKPMAAYGTAPVVAPQLKAMFALPMDATQTEFAAAWKANGNTSAPVNFGKVFDGLCELMQSEKSMGYEAALEAAKARFPQLWQRCEQMAEQPV